MTYEVSEDSGPLHLFLILILLLLMLGTMGVVREDRERRDQAAWYSPCP